MLQFWVELPRSRVDSLIAGLTQLFNVSLSKRLLYTFERGQAGLMHPSTFPTAALQLLELLETDPNPVLSNVYGAEHLLRMLGVQPSGLFLQLMPAALIPSWLELSDEESNLMGHVDLLAELIAYLNEHIVECFAEEYENTEPHYHRLIQSQYA